MLIITDGSHTIASMSSLARALSKLTKQSFRPGSGRGIAITGFTRDSGGAGLLRSRAVPSRATCYAGNGSEYSATQTVVRVRERAEAAFVSFQTLDQRELASQLAPAACLPLIASHPTGDVLQIETTSATDPCLDGDRADDDRAGLDRRSSIAQHFIHAESAIVNAGLESDLAGELRCLAHRFSTRFHGLAGPERAMKGIG